MADLALMERALRNADAAGDVEAARTIAAAIKAQQAPSFGEMFKQEALAPVRGVRDAAMGAVRGAGSIGATLMAPFDMAEDYLASRITGKRRDVSRNAQRRQDMTDALGGLGANTDSLAFGGGKLFGEVAGVAGVPAAVAGMAGATGVPATMTAAIGSGGFNAGGTTGALGVLNRMLGGSVSGGASAGLIDPESAGVGAGIGAVLPPAFQVIGKGSRAITDRVMPLFSDRAGQRAALRQVADSLGDDAGEVIPALRDPANRPAGVPLSAAAAADNAKLARLEQASRLEAPGEWTTFDANRGGEVFERLRSATKEADLLRPRSARRAANWDANWAAAEGAGNSQVFAERVAGLRAAIDSAKRSPEAVNPTVRAALDEVRRNIDAFGDDFSLAHLQKLRAEFNGKNNPISDSVLKKAPRDAKPIRDLVREFDDILNSATGGKWDTVRQGYAKDSQKVYASKAAAHVRSRFQDPGSGVSRGPTWDVGGDIPRVTEAKLRQAVTGAKMPGSGTSDLSPRAVSALSDLLESERRHMVVQRLKLAASAGGGSDTVANITALAAKSAMNAHAPGSSALLGLLKHVGSGKTDRAMAGLLMDPDALAMQLSGLLAPRPVSPLLPYLRATPLGLAADP